MQTILTTVRPGEPPVKAQFREGDEVVLASGTHQGTLGVFLGLKSDVKWADIQERNGEIRSHPLVWLAHSNSATPGFLNVPGGRQ